MVKVRWSRIAQNRKDELLTYGYKEFGRKSSTKLNNKIRDYAECLRDNPYMGKIEPLLEDSPRAYRSITIHKHYKLIYYIDGETVYITDVWDTRQEPKQLKNRLEK